MAKTQKRLTSFEKGRIMQMRNNGNTTFFIMQEFGKAARQLMISFFG